MAADLWSSMRWTALAFAPDEIARDAAVWRRSWGVTHGIPARRTCRRCGDAVGARHRDRGRRGRLAACRRRPSQGPGRASGCTAPNDGRGSSAHPRGSGCRPLRRCVRSRGGVAPSPLHAARLGGRPGPLGESSAGIQTHVLEATIRRHPKTVRSNTWTGSTAPVCADVAKRPLPISHPPTQR